MTAYELMIKTNHYLIQGGTLSDVQKNTVTEQLLSAGSSLAKRPIKLMSISGCSPNPSDLSCKAPLNSTTCVRNCITNR